MWYVVAAIVVVAIGAAVYLVLRRREAARVALVADPVAHTTPAEKRAAIAAAKTHAELRALWIAWEAQGWSKQGLLYAEVLKRKEEIAGEELPDFERLLVRKAAAAEEHAKSLPPIVGRTNKR